MKEPHKDFSSPNIVGGGNIIEDELVRAFNKHSDMRNAYIIMVEKPNQNGSQDVGKGKRIRRVWLMVLSYRGADKSLA